jgi:hypothetical protein
MTKHGDERYRVYFRYPPTHHHDDFWNDGSGRDVYKKRRSDERWASRHWGLVLIIPRDPGGVHHMCGNLLKCGHNNGVMALLVCGRNATSIEQNTTTFF